MTDKITKSMKEEALWAVHTLGAAESLLCIVDGVLSNDDTKLALVCVTRAMEQIEKDFKL